MKKSLYLLAGLSLATFLSCQKEIDWGIKTGSVPSQLYRIKSTTGTDTTQVDYTFDAAKRLIREKTAGMSAGTDISNELIINRSSSGIITTTVQKAAALVAVGVDSIVTRYNYNTSTSKYTSAVFQLTVLGFSVLDSAVFTYDASGKISMDEHYSQITGLPIPLPATLSLRNTYTYDATGKNLVGVSQEAPTTPGGPLAPLSTQTFTYDTKVNPLIVPNEAIILGRTGLFNANNATRSAFTDVTTPANNFTIDYTYRYNAINKPDSAYSVQTPPGTDTTKTKFFYQ